MNTEKAQNSFVSLGARSFAVPAPVFLVGSYDSSGKANIMAAAWGGLCASQPPCLAVSLTRTRWSYAAILERRAFTVSIPSCAQAAQADFTGITSGKDVDKFAQLGFTPQAAEHVDAPFIVQCPVVIELRLKHTLDLGSHVQMVGEIMDVKVWQHCLDDDGRPQLDRIDPLLFVPLAREYWSTGQRVAKAFSVGRNAGHLTVIDAGL